MDVARQDGRGKVAEPRMSVTVRPDPDLPAVLDLLARAPTLQAPLLLVAAGLILAFRTGLWNLGSDGQFMLGATAAAVISRARAR